MKNKARLIIPVWGERYVSKVLSITLPAVLAPGNLPALCETFDVELVIVTESRLFDLVKGSACFQATERICTVKLIQLDDLLTQVAGDYGMVLTYALFRGFADLGPRLTETYLLLLNADFIISDGSLHHLGKLMSEGHRVVHAPSFRVVLEDVWQELEAKVDIASCALQLPSRNLARLALANKHPTVTARTVNQRLRHQSWMDQYYWYVDENTMIGYQSPVALVAVKPERIVTEPTNFWDYGFLPEAAPTATPVYITDSDDFFMIEPQSRNTGREMIRVGWFALHEMALKESLRSTLQHREAARQLLTIHASDFPRDLERWATESRVYMDELYRRLSPLPASHKGHPLLGQWFEDAKARRRGGLGSRTRSETVKTAAAEPPRAHRILKSALRALRARHRRILGTPPLVNKFHPLWVDMAPICQRLTAWRATGVQNILCVGAADSLLDRLLGNRVTPAALLASDLPSVVAGKVPYDACVCQLTLEEVLDLKPLYEKIRSLVRDGGRISIWVLKERNPFDRSDVLLSNAAFPDVDISDIHFFGTVPTALLNVLYSSRVPQPSSKFPLTRLLTVNIALVLLAPVIWLANRLASRRDEAILSCAWTSLLIEFIVRRAMPSS